MKEEQVSALLERLSQLHLEGSSRGGPFLGIAHNDVTREIVTIGKSIIPRLVTRLGEASYDEAIYIVFMLRELQAMEAEEDVRRLKSEIERRSVGHDLTLSMQIEYYLRDLEKWSSASR